MKRLFRVTAAHIADGKRGADTSCPIALAFADAGYAAHVFYGKFRLSSDAAFNRRHLSAKAHEFVRRFDAYLPVEPFNFYADVSLGVGSVPY